MARAENRIGGGPSGTLAPSARLDACLGAIRGRARAFGILRAVGYCLASIAALAVPAFALDNVLHLDTALRALVSFAALAFLALVPLRRLVRACARSYSDEECALLAERGQRELGERLVNAVYLRKGDHDRFQRSVVELVTADAAGGLGPATARRAVGARALGLALGAALLGLGVLGAYGLLFPEPFLNAAVRYALPFSEHPPLSRTKLSVLPGDTVLCRGEALEVKVETEGRLPESARIQTSGGGSIAMSFDGRVFRSTIADVREEFQYRVFAGDARSRTYTVKVRRDPEIASLDLYVDSPPYSRLPRRELRASTGNVDVLAGSTVTLRIRTTLPAASAVYLPRGGEPVECQRLEEGNFEVVRRPRADEDYQLSFVGTAGDSGAPDGMRRRLGVLPDAPPRVEVVDPARDVEVETGARLLVTLRSEDDVGLAEAALLVAADPTATEGARAREGAPPTTKVRVLETWKDLGGATEVLSSGSVDPWADLPAGDGVESVLARARVVDLAGQEGFSATFRIRRRVDGSRGDPAREALLAAHASLVLVLRREEALEARTAGLAARDESEKDSSVRREVLQALAREQYDVRTLLFGVLSGDGVDARAAPLDSGTWLSFRVELRSVADELMPRVALDLLRAADGSAEVGDALGGERRIIASLRRALGTIDAVLRDGGTREGRRERALARRAELRGVREGLRALLDTVRSFRSAGEEVLARTRPLEGKTAQDFTAEETRLLEELATKEEAWGKVLEEKATDLSKVAPQDMSVGTLIEEVLELVEEIDLAAGYLAGREVELAVPLEQSGVALSERIETNIERWLLRDRDRLKWVMEEPTAEFDTPLADLPAELEDIVGELIDREELLGEETEDVTSSWLDSMDDGIGWDAMDGPISNMSAKGVTGNLQPNSSEIGGRSGEGRSGKSQGQFVEKTAGGKGGRQTPTRSTSDPFESGEVDDRGKDPSGGSTGGGKLAGAGAQGLRGAPSPEIDRKMGTLAEAQRKLRQDAEALDLELRRRRYHSQDLTRVLERMAAMESALGARRPYSYAAARREIASDLGSLGRSVSAVRDRWTEAYPPPPIRDEDFANATGEEAPPEYADLIRSYWRALSASAPAPEKGGPP